MDAHKLWMLRDFIGTNKVLFRIPVYQRNYDWSESNCNRLLDDIYDIMQSGDKHFLGTIVFMAAKSGGFALQEYIIIDGQQRLTTLMLILKALSVVAESVGDDCYHEIEEQYLHNKYCDEEFKVKLKLIKSDNNQFTLLLEDKIDEMDSSNLQTWDATPVDELRLEDLLNRMNTMINRVKAERSDLDMVCEVMLKLGVPLTYSVNKVAVNSKVAYTVGDDCLLLVCLAADITPEDVEAMAEYVPAKVIISRDSFANDTAMANAYYILRDRGVELKLL